MPSIKDVPKVCKVCKKDFLIRRSDATGQAMMFCYKGKEDNCSIDLHTTGSAGH